MNRVLDAERAARAVIADCEQRMHASLEHAREQRRSILQRAHQRIMALHERAARTLEQQTAQIIEQEGNVPDSVAAPSGEGARLREAIDRLVDDLTRQSEDDV